MESLVLDLRGNPGGLLDQAVKVCEKFLPRNQLVVSTEGRDAKQKSEYRATGRDRDFAGFRARALRDGMSGRHLFDAADRQLYAAKRRGRNRLAA